MNRILTASAILFFLGVPFTLLSQPGPDHRLFFENGMDKSPGDYTVLPYNRLIRSAGTVVTFGDSSLENHCLDLCLLPDQKNIVLEDRYGIAVLGTDHHRLIARWTFRQDRSLADWISTYSGITSFTRNGKTFMAWGACGPRHRSALMIAGWNGRDFGEVTAFDIPNRAPADKAIPNQVVPHTEGDSLYLYVVLDGNNDLLKFNFDSRRVVYEVPTGEAPYGICIEGSRAYITNWAGFRVSDTARQHAGTPWGSAYTSPLTGATATGSLTVIDTRTGRTLGELALGLHPTAITIDDQKRLLFITNGNSDNVSVVDLTTPKVIDSIPTGLFTKGFHYYGSSPDALLVQGHFLYVANAMDNALAVFRWSYAKGTFMYALLGYIPTEAYPAGIVLRRNELYVANLEARGSRVLAPDRDAPSRQQEDAYTIHDERASVSIIPVPREKQLGLYTARVKKMNLVNRTVLSFGRPDPKAAPRPVPERLGEPSVFRHVIYIIKENKTYDEIFGDLPKGRGDSNLCLYGSNVTPNQHHLAMSFALLDNYYASGKSSAEGHQWTDAAMVSDYVERNVRAWFRSYPHRQDDALVYNKNGFIWNDAMDHGRTVRIYGEACLTHYDTRMKWLDIYQAYARHDSLDWYNTTTIARIRPVISPRYPDCDNFTFTDQIRADIFINELKNYEAQPGDSLPDLVVLSLPNDHTAGTSEHFPVPQAMVADNDLALGRIVDAVSHSRFWDSTVIFVTEDDSQSGWDHLSAYRTACQVISPYTRPGATIHTAYNQTSIVRTIEQILDLPPMNVMDATALPMFDCFSSTPNHVRYTAVPNQVPLDRMNTAVARLSGRAKYFARLSANEAFRELDSGDDDAMNKILWFQAKGNEHYPPVIR